MASTGVYPVLHYHNIGQSGYDPERLSIDPDMFEQHMDYLYDAGYTVMSLQTLIAMPVAKEKCIALTFDGGYRDILYVAKEILDQYNFHATLFVPTYFIFDGLTSTHYSSDWGYMSEEELMLAGLTFDVYPLGGSNTPFTSMRTEDLREELKNAKRDLERMRGDKVDMVALPGGKTSPEVEAVLAELGYKYAFGNQSRLQRGESFNPYNINRISIMGDDAYPTFVAKLKNLPEWITRVIKATFTTLPGK